MLPEGAAAITHLSYENDLAAAEVVLRELKEKHADAVIALGLVPFVERLTVLVGEFREALKEESVREISYDQLHLAALRCNKRIRVRMGAPVDAEVVWTAILGLSIELP